MPDARKRLRWHPALEELNEDPLGVIVDRVLDTPQAQSLFGQLQEFIDRAGNAIDPKAKPRPRPRPRAKPRVAAPDPSVLARAVLQFGPAEPLTKEKITKQRRMLAALFHPDKGGSKEAMQRLNNAADVLLASL